MTALSGESSEALEIYSGALCGYSATAYTDESCINGSRIPLTDFCVHRNYLMLCFKSCLPYLLQSVVKGCPCNSVFLTPRLDSLPTCKKLPVHICPCLQTDLPFCFAYSAQFNQLQLSPTLSRYFVELRCTLWVLYYFGRYLYRRGIVGRRPYDIVTCYKKLQ